MCVSDLWTLCFDDFKIYVKIKLYSRLLPQEQVPSLLFPRDSVVFRMWCTLISAVGWPGSIKPDPASLAPEEEMEYVKWVEHAYALRFFFFFLCVCMCGLYVHLRALAATFVVTIMLCRSRSSNSTSNTSGNVAEAVSFLFGFYM